jgi:hypothetical protein
LMADLRSVYGADTDKVIVDLRSAVTVPPPPPRPEADSANDDDPGDFSDANADTIRGDIAAGVVIRDLNSELVLDTTPCQSEARLISFHEPMRRTLIGTVTCGIKKYNRMEVRQR